jgi:hypothetical protein
MWCPEPSTMKFDRMFRATDTLVSAHLVLRDRYQLRSLSVEVILLVGTALLTSAAFLEP